LAAWYCKGREAFEAGSWREIKSAQTPSGFAAVVGDLELFWETMGWEAERTGDLAVAWIGAVSVARGWSWGFVVENMVAAMSVAVFGWGGVDAGFCGG
jgi:hypothetical protein